MDNKTKGAAGGAIAGAAAGSALGPWGIAGGAVLGGIGGYFAAPDDPQGLYNYSDVDLARDNPELYRQIKELEQQRDQLKQELTSRQAGMSIMEARGLQDQKAAQASQLAGQGILGSSAGQSAQANAEALARAQIQQNAFAQRQALQQQILGADQGIGGAYSNTLASTLAAKNGQVAQNNDNNMSRASYNSGLLNSAFGGLAAAGGMYQNQQNFDKLMADRANANQQAYSPAAPPVQIPGTTTPIYRGMGSSPGVPAAYYSGPQYSLNAFGSNNVYQPNQPSLYSSGSDWRF